MLVITALMGRVAASDPRDASNESYGGTFPPSRPRSEPLSARNHPSSIRIGRMVERKLVKPEWGITENNRKARYYRITSAGRTHLADETAKLLRYSETIASVLTRKLRPAQR